MIYLLLIVAALITGHIGWIIGAIVLLLVLSALPEPRYHRTTWTRRR